ncbi:unnamed protein product [Parnassius mnemosyne]|uniref:Poly [ADP-ribose] polymerase n=1 Tax=Parnassius mnemosyne TaxID=213953 RepID=A0AAV1M2Z3_9NEOP
MSDLLYAVEYASTGKSNCKVCKQRIYKGAVRFAILLQSAFCDKKIHYWHHEGCFFKKIFLNDVSEIAKFNLLLYEDQERIKRKIENFALSLSERSKVSKRTSDDAYMHMISTFSIEYAKTSNATCRLCDVKIIRNEIRISKCLYDPRYPDSLKWYHVQCFIDKGEDLMFIARGEDIPGFKNLKEDDQKLINNAIKNAAPIIKKVRINLNNESEKKTNDELSNKVVKQSQLYDQYRKDLGSLNNNELHKLLVENGQDIPSSRKECLDRLADYMAFGVPKKCPECGSQIILSDFNYKCYGYTDPWAPCNYTTQDPDKEVMRIPETLKDNSIFKEFNSVIAQRFFRSQSALSAEVALNSHTTRILRVVFYNWEGLVVRKLTETTAAVVTTKEELEKKSTIIQNIESKKIEVIEESYFDLIDTENATVLDSLKLIKENNIANWGSDPIKRIPQNIIEGKNVPKSGSMYHRTASEQKVSKVKIMGGMEVDPQTGLEEKARIYKDTENNYSVVLSNSDAVNNKNSYYKLQLLEAKDNDSYWVFRAWGRIGTSIGGKKLEIFANIDDAKKQFISVYTQKTKNQWGSQINFVKKPGAYVPIEINYKDFRQSSIQINTNSSIPKSVQLLIMKIFDTEVMNKVLLEFELDVTKMPLGKLSKSQIKYGYVVLSELLQEFDKDRADEKKIIAATNKFYSLVPHNFGTDKPKLLDNPEIIKRKIEMLDNLLEIEITYKLLVTPSEDSLCSIESYYLKLKADIRPLDKTSADFKLIATYMKNTHAPTHTSYILEIEELFKVFRDGEDERYKKFKQLDNKRLLWHGSRITNLAGILSQGLRIAPPEAPATGYMFGKGVYFADMVSKSANYCFTNKNNPTGFVLVCEVALGEMKKCYRAQCISELPAGKHSVWGVGRTQPNPAENVVLDDGIIVPLGTPISKKVRSSLLYNEFIVYDVAQVHVKYLVQLNFKFK